MRLAAVPAGHPYTAAIAASPEVLLLPDPIHDRADPGRWWPPKVLDADWIAQHADGIDVVHVHFGMESLPDGGLETALDALDDAGVPLVYTAHDLENPQLADQRAHGHDLDLLMRRADELVTLTYAAATAIREHCGREAIVEPHPTLLPAIAPPAPQERDSLIIGTHLRDMRPNIDALGALQAVRAAVDALRSAGRNARGRVYLGDRTRDPEIAEVLARELSGDERCELIVRSRPGDTELVAEIDSLDAALLPYRHGTHSGWVETCYDRAVPVIGPALLPMSQQHPREYFGITDWADASGAIAHAIRSAPPAASPERNALVAARRSARAVGRERSASAHLALYRRAIARRASSQRAASYRAAAASTPAKDRVRL